MAYRTFEKAFRYFGPELIKHQYQPVKEIDFSKCVFEQIEDALSLELLDKQLSERVIPPLLEENLKNEAYGILLDTAATVYQITPGIKLDDDLVIPSGTEPDVGAVYGHNEYSRFPGGDYYWYGRYRVRTNRFYCVAGQVPPCLGLLIYVSAQGIKVLGGSEHIRMYVGPILNDLWFYHSYPDLIDVVKNIKEFLTTKVEEEYQRYSVHVDQQTESYSLPRFRTTDKHTYLIGQYIRSKIVDGLEERRSWAGEIPECVLKYLSRCTNPDVYLNPRINTHRFIRLAKQYGK